MVICLHFTVKIKEMEVHIPYMEGFLRGWLFLLGDPVIYILFILRDSDMVVHENHPYRLLQNTIVLGRTWLTDMGTSVISLKLYGDLKDTIHACLIARDLTAVTCY